MPGEIKRLLGLMIRLAAAAFLSILAAVVLAALALVAFALFTRGPTSCDVHDESNYPSPDGKWNAEWRSEGCSGKMLLTISFDSEILLAKVGDNAAENTMIVFRTDSPDRPTISWNDRSGLHIELSSEMTVSRSPREAQGVQITYSVSENVLKDIDTKYEQSLSPKDPALLRRLSFLDLMTIRIVDFWSHRELRRFKRWYREYAEPTQKQ